MTGITPPSAVPHYHHGHLRQALLDAAYALLREWPAAQLKLRQVARAAKVSHTASYHYFPDRTALLRALGDECMRRMVWRQQQALAAVADPGTDRSRPGLHRLRRQRTERLLLTVRPAILAAGCLQHGTAAIGRTPARHSGRRHRTSAPGRNPAAQWRPRCPDDGIMGRGAWNRATGACRHPAGGGGRAGAARLACRSTLMTTGPLPGTPTRIDRAGPAQPPADERACKRRIISARIKYF